VLAPRWQRNMMKLDRSDGGIRHARYRGRSKAGPYRQASPLANLRKPSRRIRNRAAAQRHWFADGGAAQQCGAVPWPRSIWR